MQRKLYKKANPTPLPEEDGSVEVVKSHGPLVGMYFLAWGLPVMPVAFALTIRIQQYTASRTL